MLATWGSTFQPCLDPCQNKHCSKTIITQSKNTKTWGFKYDYARLCEYYNSTLAYINASVQEYARLRWQYVAMAVVGTLASLFPAMDLEDKRRQASKHLEPTWDCCASFA